MMEWDDVKDTLTDRNEHFHPSFDTLSCPSWNIFSRLLFYSLGKLNFMNELKYGFHRNKLASFAQASICKKAGSDLGFLALPGFEPAEIHMMPLTARPSQVFCLIILKKIEFHQLSNLFLIGQNQMNFKVFCSDKWKRFGANSITRLQSQVSLSSLKNVPFSFL